MTKISLKHRIAGILISLVLIASALMLFLPGAKALNDVTDIAIDNGTLVTLKDADGDGYYDIGTADELYAFSVSVTKVKKAELTADIVFNEEVLNEVGGLNDASGLRAWKPINDTVGGVVLDGRGFTISGLYCYVSDDAGLFQKLSERSVVRNLGVVDSYFNSAEDAGGIVAWNYGGTVENCYANGLFLASQSAGGIVGSNSYNESYLGTISKCYNLARVISNKYAGGIVGRITGDNIDRLPVINCYNSGQVSASSVYQDDHGFGGIVGYAKYSYITNCYNVGQIAATSIYSGAILGRNYFSNNTISNCYYSEQQDTSSDGEVIEIGGIELKEVAGSAESRTFEQFKSGEVAYTLNGGTTNGGQAFYQVLGIDPYPSFEGDTVYRIRIGGCSEETFVYEYSIINEPSSPIEHIYSAENNGFCDYCGTFEPAVQDSDGYYRIANAGNLLWFANKVNGGSVDVNAYLTANVTVNEGKLIDEKGDLNDNLTDLIVWTPIGNITNQYKGHFMGNGYTVSGLYFADGNPTSGENVGFIGYATSPAVIEGVGVINSYIRGYEDVGGVAGYLYGATVKNCFSSATVLGDTNVGGVVGYSFTGRVEGCYNTGKIGPGAESGIYMNFGGVLGKNTGTVKSCYNLGTVKECNDRSMILGGIVGYNCDGYNVIDCYNAGTLDFVNPKSNAGAIIGFSESETNHAINCYYLVGTAPYGVNRTDIAGKSEAKTEAEFRSGEVTYLLNGGKTDGTQAYYQIVDEDYPSLDVNKPTVYATVGCTAKYSNVPNIPAEHTFLEGDNGFCECGGYQPATRVTLENYESLGLSSDYVGYYAIGNAGQLYWFALLENTVGSDREELPGSDESWRYVKDNAVLTADIVVNENLLQTVGAADFNANTTTLRKWTPISLPLNNPYIGTFDGNGHTISGLYFNDSNTDYVGLFGTLANVNTEDIQLYGTVKNLGILDSYFNGKNSVGGVAGASYGLIQNCYSVGTVIGAEYVGGLVGENGGAVINCYKSGTVSGETYVGGIAGQNNNGTVENCYYLADSETDALDGTTAKTALQFASGEVAYLLGEAFGQTLGEGGDEYPVFATESNVVYRVTYCDGSIGYSNTEIGEEGHKTNSHGYCEICEVKIASASVTVGTDLTMNYYVKLYSHELLGEGGALAMQFTMNGNTVTVYGKYNESEDEFVFAFEKIAPQCMADLIDATLVVIDNAGEITDTLASKTGYSVKAYAEELLKKNSDNTVLVNLIVDMLTYGAAAQNYREHNVENLANKDLAAELTPSDALPTESDRITNLEKHVENADVGLKSATVWFGNVNRIGLRLTATTENTRLLVNGEEVVLDGTVYYTDAISALRFGEVFTFELYEGEQLVETLTYSVNSYAYAMMSKTEEDGRTPTKMAELAKALYRYGRSADSYSGEQ